ncbi:MAG TPA: hypothetical protein VM223_12535 [Planctomycetota bacterium]|nr:hypothetical protein [Planctomycetota bacterium]
MRIVIRPRRRYDQAGHDLIVELPSGNHIVAWIRRPRNSVLLNCRMNELADQCVRVHGIEFCCDLGCDLGWKASE